MSMLPSPIAFNPASGRRRTAALASLIFTLTFALLAPGFVRAQEPTPNDDLEKLLKKVATPDDPKTQPKADPSAPASDPAPKQEAGKDKDGKPQPPKPADIGKDESGVDDLLKQLSGTEDRPETKTDKAGGVKMPSPGPEPTTKPTDVDPKSQPVDERLEEILGRIKKKKNQEPQDPQDGAMAGMIKQMREVEKRLKNPDTGEETQKKQKDIVKNMENLIKEARKMGGGQGTKIRQVKQAGQKPGEQQSQPGDQNGTTAQGVGAQNPERPKGRSELARGKDEWGHLPPELRREMNNIFKEEMLDSHKSLIERYYLSVARKTRTQGQ